MQDVNAGPRQLGGTRESVAVVGAGLMGRGCAQAFATAGFRVALCDVDQVALRRAPALIGADLTFMAERGLGDTTRVGPTLARICTTSALAGAVAGAGFVLECIPENLGTKQSLFQELETLCGPDTILATNTSMIRITQIAEACSPSSRGCVVGTHWWNPPAIMPLVEIVPGEETSEDTLARTADLLRRAGKQPVSVKKDAAGFIGNRLLHALYREALAIVEQGIADPATVDLVMKHGPGLRFPVLGPFEHMDMLGLDNLLGAYDYLFPYLDNAKMPGPLMRDKVDRGEVGFRSDGSGFQQWTSEEQQALRRTLWDYLARAVAGEEHER